MLEYAGKLYIGATNSGATMGVWDGSTITHLPVQPNDDVEALHVHEGQLLVGGRFTAVGALPARILATFDGSDWSIFGGDTLTGFAVMDFAHLAGDLYVAGDMLYGTPGSGDYVARWNGSAFESLGAGVSGMPFVLVPDEVNRSLHVGGWFYDAGDMPSWCYARWDLDPQGSTSPWADMGFALGGSAGLPRLDGSGPLAADTTVSLQIADAPPSSVTALIVGFSVVELPLLGGTLVPAVDLLLDGLATGPDGSLLLAGNWPTGVPSGFQLALQAWVVEPANPGGWAATNGVVATVP
jgi:hypothetical protein